MVHHTNTANDNAQRSINKVAFHVIPKLSKVRLACGSVRACFNGQEPCTELISTEP